MQFMRLNVIHVAVIKIFAGHTPDKAVIGRARRAMDAPRGRNHSLFVVHKNMARFGGLPHKMANGLAVGHFKIEVGFHAAVVRVRRHRIPHRTGFEAGQAHLQLAGFHAACND